VLLQLPNQYLLVVGAAYPHKNLELVLGALLEVRLTRPDCKLIVVGRGDTFMEGLKKTTQSMGLEAHILFWGEATEAELATLYESAAAYLVPSLSEGFGLGAVEALTHGTPVVAADIPVFHEVLGQAAVFIDPASVTSLVHGIERALEPKVREDLRQAARPMLARLSWQKVGRLTREVYESCVEE
jgi:glycosyltransferase involved in cell wall biosynthesis